MSEPTHPTGTEAPKPEQLVPLIIEALMEDITAVDTAMAFARFSEPGKERLLEEARDAIWAAVQSLQQWTLNDGTGLRGT